MAIVVLLLVAAGLLYAGLVGSVVFALARPGRKTEGVALGRGLPIVPADAGLEGEAAVFTLSQGESTPGFIVRGDRADGPVCVVLHGFQDARYNGLLRAWFVRQWVSATVLFDLPGHGDSAAKTPTYGKREPADVAAVLDQLPDELRGRPVVLMGYSMGGQLVLRTAASDAVTPAGVICEQPYRCLNGPIVNLMRRRRYPVRAVVPVVVWLLERVFGIARRFDRVEDAATLGAAGCPLWVAHGEADWLCPVEDGQAIAEAAQSAGGTTRLDVFPGSGHVALFYEDAERYTAGLAWLFEQADARPDTPIEPRG
ncbi:MAG: alpha/beta fold hydrolase [Planctomycetota bacterium]